MKVKLKELYVANVLLYSKFVGNYIQLDYNEDEGVIRLLDSDVVTETLDEDTEVIIYDGSNDCRIADINYSMYLTHKYIPQQ